MVFDCRRVKVKRSPQNSLWRGTVTFGTSFSETQPLRKHSSSFSSSANYALIALPQSKADLVQMLQKGDDVLARGA